MMRTFVRGIDREPPHGELLVLADAGARPVVVGETGEAVREALRHFGELVGDRAGVELVVAAVPRARVRVDAAELGPVLAEGAAGPVLGHQEHVARVAGVLERGPGLRRRAGADERVEVLAGKAPREGGAVAAPEGGERLDELRGPVVVVPEAALRAAPARPRRVPGRHAFTRFDGRSPAR